MLRRHLLPMILCALLALTAAPGVQADARSSGEAARQAAAQTGGRVLDVRAGRSGGRVVYTVKVLLDDGRVKAVRIDGGRSGGGRR